MTSITYVFYDGSSQSHVYSNELLKNLTHISFILKPGPNGGYLKIPVKQIITVQNLEYPEYLKT